MLEPRDNLGTGAVALPGRNIFATPAATNSDERARKRKGFDAAAACQPTAVSDSIDDCRSVASEPAVRGLRLRPASGTRVPKRRGGAADDSTPQTADLDAAIAEAVEHAAGLVQVAHEAAEMAVRILGQLAELLEERSPASDADTAQRADAASERASVDALPAASWRSRSSTRTPVAWAWPTTCATRSWCMAPKGPRESAGRDLEARCRAAHREAARLQAQNRAVRAQNEQVIRRRSRANPAQPPDSAEPAGNEAEDDPGHEGH